MLDAERIINAVSCHDELLSALRSLVHELDQEPPQITPETYLAAKDAIRKAEG